MSQFQSHVYVQRTCTENKGITTMAIGPLDDHTYCARSAFTHLGALAKAVGLFIASLHNHPIYPKMCLIGIFDKYTN